jgi:hypothetical protein
MPDSFTTNLNLTKPEVGFSNATWGSKLNTDLDQIDALFDTGPVLKIASGGTGASTAASARTSLGLGSISTQDAANVAITGGSIGGSTAISVAHQIESTSGGFKFPDGSIQSSAVSATGLTWSTQSANFVAIGNNGYLVTTSGVVSTIASGQAASTRIGFINGVTSRTGTFTINPPSGETIQGASSLVVDVTGASFSLVKIGADWRIF